MTARSHNHGHRMYFDESIQEWKYEDDDTLVKDGYRIRACGHCGRHVTDESQDPCIVNLPGVRSACCGHDVINITFYDFHDSKTDENGTSQK